MLYGLGDSDQPRQGFVRLVETGSRGSGQWLLKFSELHGSGETLVVGLGDRRVLGGETKAIEQMAAAKQELEAALDHGDVHTIVKRFADTTAKLTTHNGKKKTVKASAATPGAPIVEDDGLPGWLLPAGAAAAVAAFLIFRRKKIANPFRRLRGARRLRRRR